MKNLPCSKCAKPNSVDYPTNQCDECIWEESTYFLTITDKGVYDLKGKNTSRIRQD